MSWPFIQDNVPGLVCGLAIGFVAAYVILPGFRRSVHRRLTRIFRRRK